MVYGHEVGQRGFSKRARFFNFVFSINFMLYLSMSLLDPSK